MIHQNFDAALEQDILRLSHEVHEQRQEQSAAETHPKEIVRSVIGSHIQAAPAPAPSGSDDTTMLPNYLQAESPDVRLKVEELVDVAFHKGIDASVTEAKKYGPFILDALHDTLTTKLYDELKARKLL
ncbi:MAG: hypothetical protein KGI60_01030 [Patescibacteria group bacterium]|nr:hypothetical protein [Patescibacteria group bacterium]